MSRLERVVTNRGSTLPAAILRLGLPLLLWARFAREVHPMRHVGEWEWWALAVAFYLTTSLMFVGLWSRLTTALTGGVLVWMIFGFGVFGEHDDWAHHHTYAFVVPVLMLALTPCGASWSLDRWLALRRGDAPPQTGDLWALRLIGMQLSAMYLWAAYDKTHMGYLGGDRLEQILGTLYLGSDYPEGAWFGAVTATSATLSVLLEYALAVLPWFERTRAPILVLGVLFHAVIYWTMPVGTYSLTMILLYVVFFPPDAVATLLQRLR